MSPTFSPTFDCGLVNSWYLLRPNVYVVSSHIIGSVTEDGLHFSAIDSWTVYGLDESSGYWGYCSGYDTALGDRL